MRSSQAAVDLIIASEVGSKAQYERLYEYPEWPGGKSGITVGIGYDLGYVTREKIVRDWAMHLSTPMVEAMCSVAGLKGSDAHSQLASVKHLVQIPWDKAMAVFEEVDLPTYEAYVVHACPRSVELPPDCFGVLTSIVYNRGPGGFSSISDRYREMQAIKRDIANGDWGDIPEQIRSMKRLWDKDQSGLLTRRDAEARLFEVGLSKPVTSTGTQPAPGPVQKNDDGLNVQPQRGKYDLAVEVIQRKLVAMNYHEVGDIDGKMGGRTKGAIKAFMNDRGKPSNGELSADVVNEVNAALDAQWSRPIAPKRAEATVDDVSKKTPILQHNAVQKVLAFILALPSAFAAVFKLIFGEQATLAGYMDPVKNLFAEIPSEFYLVVIAGIGIAIFMQALKIEKTTVQSYRIGEIN